MNFRLTTVLIGAVLLVGGVLLVRTFVVGPAAGDTLLVGLDGVKGEGIDEVVIERTDPPAALKLKRVAGKDNEWEIVEPIRARANGPAVKAVVDSLLKAKPTVFAELQSNPAVHGLQPPGLRVTLRQGDRSGTLNVGNVSFGGRDAVVFVTTTAKPDRPVAVRRADLDALFRQDQVGGGGKGVDLAKWTSDYRTTAIFPSDSRAVGEDVESVKLELPNKGKTLALTHTPGGWKFDSPAGWGDADVEGDAAGPPGTFTGVRRLLGALTGVSATGPADFIDQPKDLKEYGLDAGNPDLVKVTMKAREGQATVFVGKREDAPTPPKGGVPLAPPPGGKVFVRIDGQPGVIRATAGDLAGLVGVIQNPDPLRDRTLVALDRAKVDGVDVVLAGQPADKPTKLRRVGMMRQWTLYGGPGDPQPAFGAPVEKLLDVVLAKRAIKDFPAPNPANFAAVSATVSVWADGFAPGADEKAEPAKKGEPVKLEFGRKDGDAIYVRRTRPGLPPDEFTLPAQVKLGALATEDVSAAVTLTRLDLLDRSLPSFADTAPARVTVTGANTYTLARDPKPDPLTKELLWRFDPSDPRKGQVADAAAVADLLGLLGTSAAAFGKFVEEDPPEAKLAADYGLAPPRLKVMIGFGPESGAPAIPERGFEFGKDTADPDKVYARVVGKKAVFTIQRRALDRCTDPGLRDRAVFRAVDAPAVNKVELKGWGDLTGTPQELVFEKNKDGVWAVTKSTLAGFAVDPAKVTAFVDVAVRTRARSFEQGAMAPKHGFGDPKQNLAVTLRWPAGAVSFNLGASPDGGTTYYGWSAWLPATDPVFTLDAAPFKPFKDKPGGFAK